ncbi:MAG TPA: hypothetical protein DIS90_06140 [Cytophagales bacterium]|nr:hypothetical protein [Cytophagales bacterium]HCR53964.1 hypothetical protein [Cytophagales bacterium]
MTNPALNSRIVRLNLTLITDNIFKKNIIRILNELPAFMAKQIGLRFTPTSKKPSFPTKTNIYSLRLHVLPQNDHISASKKLYRNG